MPLLGPGPCMYIKLVQVLHFEMLLTSCIKTSFLCLVPFAFATRKVRIYLQIGPKNPDKRHISFYHIHLIWTHFVHLSLARTVMKAPKSCHITPILRLLHWLRITERIEYKLLSLTYKVLTTIQPPYLHKLISTQRSRSTRSSSVVTLARPPSSSSLKITDRSFRYASPCLKNQPPLSLRKPHSGTSSSISCSPIPSPVTSSSSDSPLCTSLFHSRLITYLFHKSYPLSFTSSSRTASTDFCLHRSF